MNNEEAIVIMENERPHCGKRITFTEEEKCEAYDMAIAVLKIEPCEDCVSREVVLDTLTRIGYWKHDSKEAQTVAECMRAIEKLPPVTPKKKTGRWIRELIRNEKGGCIGAKMICSECGNDNKHDEYMDFCPNCDAEMKGEIE